MPVSDEDLEKGAGVFPPGSHELQALLQLFQVPSPE